MTQTIDQNSPPTNWPAPTPPPTKAALDVRDTAVIVFTIPPSAKTYKSSGCGTWTKR